MVLNTVASLFLSLSEGWFHMFSDSVTDIRNVEFTIMGLLQLTLTRIRHLQQMSYMYAPPCCL